MEAPARMRSVWRRRFTTLTGESLSMTLPAVPLSETTYAASSTWCAGDGLDARVAEAVEPVGKVTHVPGGDDVVAHVERHGALHVVADDLLVVELRLRLVVVDAGLHLDELLVQFVRAGGEVEHAVRDVHRLDRARVRSGRRHPGRELRRLFEASLRMYSVTSMRTTGLGAAWAATGEVPGTMADMVDLCRGS